MQPTKSRRGLVSFFSFRGEPQPPARPASRSEIESPMQVSAPTDFKRLGHVSYRAATGLFSGLDAPVILFFGVPVTQQIREDVPGYPDRIPSMLTLLAKELIKRDGLTAEGIFRVPAESMSIERARAALNAGRGLVGIESEPGPHVVASLIKDWFRSLSPDDAILSRLSKEMIVRLSADNMSPAEVYATVSNTLSEPNNSIFCWILDLLAVVCAHSKDNLMSPAALATVYSPTLRAPAEATMEAFAVMADLSKVIARCIKYVADKGDLEAKERVFAQEDHMIQERARKFMY